MTEIRRQYDDANYDLLVCRRMECFFTPNDDGTPSADGRVLMHTEWMHYSGELLRGRSLGPQIERSIQQLLPGTYAGVSGEGVLAALKDLFLQCATPTAGSEEV